MYDLMTTEYIGIDLDGTLAQIIRTPSSLTDIGLPVPLMLQRVQHWIKEGKEVRIITARVNAEDNPNVEKNRVAIDKWLKKYVGQSLPITSKKSHNMIELWDDRAIQVIPNTGERVLDLDGQLLAADIEELHCSSHTYHASGCAECYHKAILSSYVRNESLEKAHRIAIHALEIKPEEPSPKIQMITQQLQRKVHIFLYNAASDIATALRKKYVKKSDKSTKEKEALLIAWAAIQWNELVNDMYSDLFEAAKIGATEAVAQLNLDSPEIRQKIEDSAEQYAKTRTEEIVGEGTRYSVADATKDDLQAMIDNQSNEAVLASDISTAKTFGRARAELIADTEITMATVFNHLSFWKHSGKVKSVNIVLSSDHVVDDHCDVVAFGSPYLIDDCPEVPIHPNCKCAIIVHELNG
jgi:hypothetical protein